MNAMSERLEPATGRLPSATGGLSPGRTARVAGFLYILMGIASAFGIMYVSSKVSVPGDAAATISNMLGSERLVRLGFVANLAGQVTFLFLGHFLYRLLESVDRDQARLMVILIVASVPIAMLSMLGQFTALLIARSGYISGLEPAQRNVLAILFLDIQNNGILVAQIFWGLWLFPFGRLVFKSTFLPKWLGVLLMAGCFGYLIDCVVSFLFPSYRVVSYPGLAIASVAELSCILRLLVGTRRHPMV